jgi:hypothetical protein
MAQDFLRRIDGYNRPFYVLAELGLARNAWLTANAPSGPGRIEAIHVLCNDAGSASVLANAATLTVDGVVLVSLNLRPIFLCYDVLNFSGPVSARYTSATYTNLQLRSFLDYESSASLAIRNTASPDPTTFWITLIGRVGR